MTNKATLGMTVLAGTLVAPMLAFGQAANTSTTPPGTAPTTQMQRTPDGTPGNPPGTAASRALDRATGTNTSGAFPNQADGTPGNPPGTAVGRAADRAGDAASDATSRAGDTVRSATTPGGAATSGTTPGTVQHGQTGSSAMGRMDSTTTSQPLGQGSANVGTTGAATGATAGAAGAAAVMGGLLGERQRVSQVIGSRVYNERNESIGEVDDIVVSGPQPMAIISVGGFLGIGARLVSVPMSELQWNGERERIMLPGSSREQLQSRPEFSYDSLRRS